MLGCVTPNLPLRRDLRLRFRSLRRQLDEPERAEADRRIVAEVLALPVVQRAARLGLFQAFDGEPDLASVATWALAQGRTVAYPRHTPGAPLAFVEAERWGGGAGGAPQPEGRPVALERGDVVLVSGAAFDSDGYRLGLGGGHYDRTLATCKALAVGIAYACQRIERLERAPWDQPVEFLVTEAGVQSFQGRASVSSWS